MIPVRCRYFDKPFNYFLVSSIHWHNKLFSLLIDKRLIQLQLYSILEYNQMLQILCTLNQGNTIILSYCYNIQGIIIIVKIYIDCYMN